MKTATLSQLAAFSVVVVLSTATAQAQSQSYIVKPELNDNPKPTIVRPELNGPGTRLIKPNPGPSCGTVRPIPPEPIPTLGFYGYVSRDGMVITRVLRGSRAWSVGLEEGDVIVAVDNVLIRRDGDYEYAMRRAGRFVDLEVQDVRGRGTYLVEVNLMSGPGLRSEPVSQLHSSKF